MADFDVSVDIRDVTRLAAQLAGAGRRAVHLAGDLVAQTAEEIRDDLRTEARGHPTFPSFPQAITHDVRGLDAEIGPDKQRRQGALGNILYFGGVRTGPVLPHPGLALERAVPGFAAKLAQVGEDAIGGDR